MRSDFVLGPLPSFFFDCSIHFCRPEESRFFCVFYRLSSFVLNCWIDLCHRKLLPRLSVSFICCFSPIDRFSPDWTWSPCFHFQDDVFFIQRVFFSFAVASTFFLSCFPFIYRKRGTPRNKTHDKYDAEYNNKYIFLNFAASVFFVCAVGVGFTFLRVAVGLGAGAPDERWRHLMYITHVHCASKLKKKMVGVGLGPFEVVTQ